MERTWSIAQFRATGKPVPDALLGHTSPLTWKHIGFSCDLLARLRAPAGVRHILRAPAGCGAIEGGHDGGP